MTITTVPGHDSLFDLCGHLYACGTHTHLQEHTHKLMNRFLKNRSYKKGRKAEIPALTLPKEVKQMLNKCGETFKGQTMWGDQGALSCTIWRATSKINNKKTDICQILVRQTGLFKSGLEKSSSFGGGNLNFQEFIEEQVGNPVRAPWEAFFRWSASSPLFCEHLLD